MSSTVVPPARYPQITPRGEELASRILDSVTAASELLTIELGRRLGLYSALVDAAETTAPQLARRSGIAPRYCPRMARAAGCRWHSRRSGTVGRCGQSRLSPAGSAREGAA